MKNIAFIQDFGPLVGRVLLALLFVLAGFNKITGFEGTAGGMESAGLPLVTVLLVLTILIELGGGLMVAVGWFARWAAAIMFLFIIPVIWVYHNPMVDPDEMIAMLKNLAIMGGLLYVVVNGPGKYSVNDE